MMIQMKRAHDQQIVPPKDGGPSKRQAQTNRLKFYARDFNESGGLTHRRAIKENDIAINRDWVYNQTSRLSHEGLDGV